MATSGTILNLSESKLLRARVLQNGQWSALNEAEFTATPLTPHALADSPFVFSEWSHLEPVGTYPDYVIFEQTSTNDPALSVEMDSFWTLPYNLSNRSRINGLDADGIDFRTVTYLG